MRAAELDVNTVPLNWSIA